MSTVPSSEELKNAIINEIEASNKLKKVYDVQNDAIKLLIKAIQLVVMGSVTGQFGVNDIVNELIDGVDLAKRAVDLVTGK